MVTLETKIIKLEDPKHIPLTDVLCDFAFYELRQGKTVMEHIQGVMKAGGAGNIFESLDLVRNPETDGSIMNWLVRNERYEDAAWLKQVCEEIYIELNVKNEQEALKMRTTRNGN